VAVSDGQVLPRAWSIPRWRAAVVTGLAGACGRPWGISRGPVGVAMGEC